MKSMIGADYVPFRFTFQSTVYYWTSVTEGARNCVASQIEEQIVEVLADNFTFYPTELLIIHDFHIS